MIRPELADFIALGKLPSEDDDGPDEALEAAIDHAADLLDRIARPVSDEEAHALAECFGEDECFGVGWVLLHLIETAPHAREDQPEAARRWREGLTS
ncbi:hypothetical protein [Streptomyces olivochromogenes]|uniref:hypothetical protein n=1 Tax=Streptomyces olivochromogenes TaxID=1963 RepID=UPI00131EB2DF|nr:hypothetical protein [Streptomyces olivochromogenes]